jgi:patatin-like phospholipase/acyl hydrolase
MLCLDGGGIRGLVSAMVVEELEKILNQAIIKKNDFLLMAESSLDDPDGSGETHHEQQKFIREIREKLPKKSPEGQFIRLWHLFDVVIGTSTGSLLAYGIGMTRLSGKIAIIKNP